MKKIISMLLAVLMLACCFAGCAKSKPDDSDLAYILNKGTLVVGITDYAPMDYPDGNGGWTGFDAEFAKLVGAKLGVKVEFIEIDWDNKFFELNSKKIDAIWNGMTISQDVTLNADVSNPYVENAQVVVMKADKVGEYTTVESVLGLTFAVENGSAGQEAAQDAGVPADKIVASGAQSDALLEVASGRVDACVIDITMANAMTGSGTSYADLAKAVTLTSEEYGIGMRKGSNLVQKINEIMAELMKDGTLDALAAKYELTLIKQ